VIQKSKNKLVNIINCSLTTLLSDLNCAEKRSEMKYLVKSYVSVKDYTSLHCATYLLRPLFPANVLAENATVFYFAPLSGIASFIPGWIVPCKVSNWLLSKTTRQLSGKPYNVATFTFSSLTPNKKAWILIFRLLF
jgi:hypothetical protein